MAFATSTHYKGFWIKYPCLAGAVIYHPDKVIRECFAELTHTKYKSVRAAKAAITRYDKKHGLKYTE